MRKYSRYGGSVSARLDEDLDDLRARLDGSLILGPGFRRLLFLAVFVLSTLLFPVAASSESSQVSRSECQRATPDVARGSSWPAARRELIPTSVLSIRLCCYSGAHLARDVVLSPARTGELIQVFDALKPATAAQRHAFPSCFFYTNPVVAIITYSDGHALDVYTNTDSCVFPGNGETTRLDPERLRMRLVTLLLRDSTVSYGTSNAGRGLEACRGLGEGDRGDCRDCRRSR